MEKFELTIVAQGPQVDLDRPCSHRDALRDSIGRRLSSLRPASPDAQEATVSPDVLLSKARALAAFGIRFMTTPVTALAHYGLPDR